MSTQPSDTNHKKYNINRDSWHYRFNNWVYGYREPQSFCPYFWGTILAIPLAPIMGIAKGIIAAKEHHDKNKPEPKPKVYKEPRVSYETKENIGLGIVLFLLIGLPIILVVYGLITNLERTIQILLVVGVILGFVGLVVGAVLGISALHSRYREKHPKVYKRKQPNMLSLGLKSWYKKNCPLVEYK